MITVTQVEFQRGFHVRNGQVSIGPVGLPEIVLSRAAFRDIHSAARYYYRRYRLAPLRLWYRRENGTLMISAWLPTGNGHEWKRKQIEVNGAGEKSENT